MPTWRGWRDRKIKAYITGICGFAGSWLAEELLACGYEVRGTDRPNEDDRNLAPIRRRIKIDRFDITDAEACRKFLAKARPHYLFHLAAAASVRQSFDAPEKTFRINTIGTHHLFEAVRGQKQLKRLLFVSSSDIYGPVRPKDLPLTPRKQPSPVSPYAQSKAAAEYLAHIYIENYDLPIVIVRPFNHSGPRQSPDFVIPAFARKIAIAERAKGKKTVTVGNLTVRRDMSDVRDIVRGYRLLAEKGKIGHTYHLSSGKAYRIGDLLNRLISFATVPIIVKPDPKLYCKRDIPVLRGSFSATTKDTGWKPAIRIETTLADTLDYWRRRK